VILVDTSAWVEYDRATGSEVDLLLTELVGRGGDDIAVTEPVLMEVLAGARDERRFHDLRRLLGSFGWLPAHAVVDLEAAAVVYRRCREAGVTPRGLVDCMIAGIAIRTGSTLLTADGDFVAMAAVVPLRLVFRPA
jgi:predicted nucleic acid-binding protein